MDDIALTEIWPETSNLSTYGLLFHCLIFNLKDHLCSKLCNCMNNNIWYQRTFFYTLFALLYVLWWYSWGSTTVGFRLWIWSLFPFPGGEDVCLKHMSAACCTHKWMGIYMYLTTRDYIIKAALECFSHAWKFLYTMVCNRCTPLLP